MSNLQFFNQEYYQPRVGIEEGQESIQQQSPQNAAFEINDDYSHKYSYPSGSYIPTSTQTSFMPSDRSVLSKIKESHATRSPTIQNAAPAASLEKRNLQLQIPSSNDLDMTLTSEFPLSGSTNDDMSPSGNKMNAGAKSSKRERPRSHTPRPSNSFILYRREKHIEIMSQYKGVKALNNNVISKIVANMWRAETPEVKAHFTALADEEKRAHMLKYPDYKYRPRKSVSKKSSPTRKSIATPRTMQMDSPTHQIQMDAAFESNHNVFHPNMGLNVQKPISYMAQPHMSDISPSYQAVHIINPNARMPMVESDHTYDIMAGERFVMSHPFQTNDEFMGHDTLLPDSNGYNQSWNIGGSTGVWDLDLDQKPFDHLSK